MLLCLPECDQDPAGGLAGMQVVDVDDEVGDRREERGAVRTGPAATVDPLGYTTGSAGRAYLGVIETCWTG